VKKIWLTFWALAALAVSAISAQASAISDPIIYDSSNSAAKVQIVTVTTGDLDVGSTFNLVDALKFKDTSKGKYGELITYIPITVSSSATLDLTITDLLGTTIGTNMTANKSPEWFRVQLFTYDPLTTDYSDCNSSLCSLVPGTQKTSLSASIIADLVAGTHYLLKIGFGICGCTGTIGGINLSATLTATPIPPSLLLMMTALLSMGGAAWLRSKPRLLQRVAA
jgi:hypothetical protein